MRCDNNPESRTRKGEVSSDHDHFTALSQQSQISAIVRESEVSPCNVCSLGNQSHATLLAD
jgi:hypothetical protein